MASVRIVLPSAAQAAQDPSQVNAPLNLELDRRHARRELEHVGGNKVQAAEILGISRATLYRLVADNQPETMKEAKQTEP